MAIVTGDNGDNNLVGTANDDEILGLGGADVLEGLGGGDVLDGGAGGDSLFGNGGDDRLIGGAGVNELTGGSGTDVFVLSDREGTGLSDDRITDFEIGVDKVDLSAWGVPSIYQLEKVLTSDGQGGATLNASYNGIDHVLTFVDIEPGELGRNDFLFADFVDDKIVGTSQSDTLFGKDEITPGVLKGHGGDDILIAGRGNKVYGNAGNDRLFADTFADMYGGGGDDYLQGATEMDLLYGGGGNDVVAGGKGNDIISGDHGKDLLKGGGGGDSLYGGHGKDVLFGGGGRDRLIGGPGKDKLNGGYSRDNLQIHGGDKAIGGPGYDTFLFRELSDLGPDSRRDLILDFTQGVDQIDVEYIYTVYVDNSWSTNFDFIGDAEFTDIGQIRYFVSGNRTVVQGNVIDDLGPELEFELAGQHTLVADDFVL